MILDVRLVIVHKSIIYLSPHAI